MEDLEPWATINELQESGDADQDHQTPHPVDRSLKQRTTGR